MLDSDVLDSSVEEECSADKNLYEVYLVYKEARDTLNQVRRGRGYWPVIAIHAPDGRSATLAERNNDESFQADLDMPQAKRRVTFSRPPVGTGVSQAWSVETWTVAPSAESADIRLKMWTSQEINSREHEPHECHHDHA